MEIGTEDRVWILTQICKRMTRALELARHLANQFIPFAAIASEKPDDDE